MSGISAKTTLERISLGHLKCTVCCKRFIDPKVLDCLHSFCFKCLDDQNLLQQATGPRIVCTLCRRETVLPDTGVEGIRDNLTLISLVEESGLQEQLVASQLSKIKCESCDEEQEAISRCMDCDDYLCKDCQWAHKRLSKMKNHKIATMADLRSGNISFRSKVRGTVPKCEKHTNQDICHFCKPCQSLICTACSVGDHKTEDHEAVDVHGAMVICQTELGELLSKAKDHKDEFEAAKLSTEHARKRLVAMVANATNKISKKAEEEVAKIRQRELDLKQQVEQIERDRSSEIENFQASLIANLKWSKHSLDIVEDFLTQGSPYEVLELRNKILLVTKDISNKPVPVLQHGLSFVDFKDSIVGLDGSFGRLLLEEKWEMKDEFGKRGMGDGEFMEARSIAAYSNNDLAVADPFNGRITIFSSDGKYKSSIRGSSENNPDVKLQKPGAITMSRDDQLLVVDNPVVRVFNTKGQQTHQFIPSRDTTSSSTENSEEEPESDLRCIAVDYKNQIAIGDKGKKIVSLHQSDGTFIRITPAEMIAKHVAIGNMESIIYTNIQARLLMASDAKGQEIFSIHTLTEENPLFEPTGVCCDGSGDIYLALQATVRGQKGEIHHFSPKGEHIACVARGLNSPYGLTFTPAGDLAVADLHNIKIYQRV